MRRKRHLPRETIAPARESRSLITVCAAIVPAARAARVDPMVALRYETMLPRAARPQAFGAAAASLRIQDAAKDFIGRCRTHISPYAVSLLANLVAAQRTIPGAINSSPHGLRSIDLPGKALTSVEPPPNFRSVRNTEGG